MYKLFHAQLIIIHFFRQREDNERLYGTKYAVTDDQAQIILSVDSQDQARYR